MKTQKVGLEMDLENGGKWLEIQRQNLDELGDKCAFEGQKRKIY